MPEEAYLYVIFSSTPCKVGASIRFFTHHFYNHVSIAFCKDLREMYSYARHFHDTPFYAGIVCERANRFLRRGTRKTKIKVMRLPVEKEKLAALQKHCESLYAARERTVYNFYSAFLVPLGKRVLLKNSYTCAEFSLDSICRAGDFGLNPEAFYSIAEMEKRLAAFCIYEGDYPETTPLLTDDFDTPHSFFAMLGLSLALQGRLWKKFLSEKILKSS